MGFLIPTIHSKERLHVKQFTLFVTASLSVQPHHLVTTASPLPDIDDKEDESDHKRERRNPQERHPSAIVISRADNGEGFIPKRLLLNKIDLQK